MSLLVGKLFLSYSDQRSIGQWQNPEDKSSEKNRLPYWIELAQLLERGKFNALFLGKSCFASFFHFTLKGI